jgi:hypothetical protein
MARLRPSSGEYAHSDLHVSSRDLHFSSRSARICVLARAACQRGPISDAHLDIHHDGTVPDGERDHWGEVDRPEDARRRRYHGSVAAPPHLTCRDGAPVSAAASPSQRARRAPRRRFRRRRRSAANQLDALQARELARARQPAMVQSAV